MARPRVISVDTILDAAEAVVAREGAARLTLDAVAAEAGISKGSVVYDYGSKEALIKAVIERQVALEGERQEKAAARFGNHPDAVMLGRIAVAAERDSEDNRSVSVNLCSALVSDGQFRTILNQAVSRDIETVRTASKTPRSALVAYLAVEGMRALQALGLYEFPAEERRRLLDDIRRLLAVDFDAIDRTE
jgi:AcrR family transcriptional regulator